MNFHTRPEPIGRETIPVAKPPLSSKASEILAIMEEVRLHPDTATHLSDEEGNGRQWLPMCNINNGHVEASEEYQALMSKLSDALNTNLITNDGQHSDVYYELHKAGYRLRVGEKDSFGPLSVVFTCPNDTWQVCYG
jgi:hypothetical protein